MKSYLFALGLGAGVLAFGQATTPDVGSGSPTVSIQQQFQLAYYRGGFANLVAYPPLADVKRLGTNGLVQEFSDAAKTTGVKLALVMPNASAAVVQGVSPVFQMQAGLYAYFTQLGVNTTGMPTSDSINCPALLIANTCQYQVFDKPYALFAFKSAVGGAGTTFATRDPFYTKWNALGGANSLGPAVSAETAVTSSAGTKATAQYFDRGVIYNVTSGTSTGRILAVKTPIYSLFVSNNLEQGFLGIPTSDELILPNGRVRQNFEGGSIEYDPANPSIPPTLRTPVGSVVVSAPANPVRLNLGDTITLQAGIFDPNGVALTDRSVAWTTSNGRVVSVAPAGASVTVKAVGAGMATVSATSEGKTSVAVSFVVTAPCCQIGEGAPSQAVSQAFQDAVTRNHLIVKSPNASSAVRSGSGYVQQLEGIDPGGATYALLIAVPDRVLTAFVITGKLLSRYLELGGPTGMLSYPTSDATAGGRQNFENGALAGSPVPQVVSGDFLAKWALLAYESGAVGNPTGGVTDALTFRATPVQSQPFQYALLIAIRGTRKVYVVSGLVRDKYLGSGGPGGSLGAPAGDDYVLNGRRRQDFEGGFIDYAPGDAEARVTESPRQPVVSATPASVLAGTPVHLAIGGFDNGATVRVSIAGQPDFTVAVANGSYTWDSYIAIATKSGPVTVRAVDATNSAKAAQASYTVRALADTKLQLIAARGDNQSGAPGALLPAPLVVVLKDDAGNLIPGSPVKFTASPGARVESASLVTDSNGEAQSLLRLPASEAVALVSVEAGRQQVTLSARATRTALANFPALSQAVPGTIANTADPIAAKGALLTAAASIVRYYQSRGDAPAPHGLADPVTLNQYLKNLCLPDSHRGTICDGFVRVGDSADAIVNLWRIPSFAGGALAVIVDSPDLSHLRDWVGRGSPVLVALELRTGGVATGSHFVAAAGVGADGSVLIVDPDPASTKTTLDAYLRAGAVITGLAVFLPKTPSTAGFLVVANATVDLSSAAASCGSSFGIAGAGSFHYCDGAASVYELDLNGRGTFTDLGSPSARYDLNGSGPTSFKATRSGVSWTVGPMDVAIGTGGILNAASFTDAIAPGELVSIFGTGFGRDAKAIAVDFNGVPGKVVAAFPFQLNVQVPPDLPPGPATARVTGQAGTAQQDIVTTATAPALFTLGGTQGAVINIDGTVNSPSSPARRGDVIVAFGTGFGAVSGTGNLMPTHTPVTAALRGIAAPVLFSGLTPGYLGLYQLNIVLPVSMAPGLRLALNRSAGEFYN